MADMDCATNISCSDLQSGKLPYNIKVVIMAGGRGKRLEPITQGKIPKDFVVIDPDSKKRGIDHIQAALGKNCMTDVTYSANYYLSQYQEALAGRSTKFHYQKEDIGHGRDLMEIIQAEGMNSQYLVLPTDMYFHSDDLGRLLQQHKPGTISWGVTLQSYPEMEMYRIF